MVRSPQIKNGKVRLALGNIVYRDVNIHHHMAMMGLGQLVAAQGEYLSRTVVGDTLVSRGRSELASWFLRTDADVLLSIDSDIEFNPQDALDLAAQADEFGLVGAPYKMRDGKMSAGSPVRGLEPLRAEVDYLAGGFMAVHRRVFEALVPTLQLCHEGRGERAFYPFYLPMIKEINGSHIYLSEDWAFCERAREAGFQPILDPSIRLIHHGDKGYEMEE